MKKIVHLSAFIFVLVFLACNSTQSKHELSKEDYFSKIDSIEKKIRQMQIIDNATGTNAIAAYTNYAQQFPNDSITPDYLFKAGEIASSVRQGQRAIDIYNSIYEKYPSYKKVHYCLFLQAFIYETQLNNIEKARVLYNKVIEKYPNESIAHDAKACIQNLGKSDEELIKEFEARNKKSS